MAKSILKILVFLNIFLSIFSLSGCTLSGFRGNELFLNEKQRNEIAEEKIKGSPSLQELDKLCRQLPMPEEFKFVSKHVVGSSDSFVSFNYRSEKSYPEARDFFLNYFKVNGWESRAFEGGVVHEIKGKKDNYVVSISYGGTGTNEIDYSISCEKPEESN